MNGREYLPPFNKKVVANRFGRRQRINRLQYIPIHIADADVAADARSQAFELIRDETYLLPLRIRCTYDRVVFDRAHPAGHPASDAPNLRRPTCFGNRSTSRGTAMQGMPANKNLVDRLSPARSSRQHPTIAST